MFCVLCRRLFWRDPKPEGRLSSRSRTRAIRRAAVETRSSVRAMRRDDGPEIRDGKRGRYAAEERPGDRSGL